MKSLEAEDKPTQVSTAKKGTVLVMSGTSNMTFAMGTLLLNLKEISPNLFDEVIIYNDGYISRKDKKIINLIYPTTFIKYEPPYEDKTCLQTSTMDYFSPLVLAKFECLKLLEEYRKVIFTDYDITAITDLSELKADSPAPCKMMLCDNIMDNFIEPLENYEMKGNGISCALFVLTDKLDYKSMYKFCYDMYEKNFAKLRLPEQACFSIMVREFNIDVESIPEEYCVLPTPNIERMDKIKIAHSFGPKKFWNGLEYEPWNKYYKQWQNLGGSAKNKKRKVISIKKNKTKNYQIIVLGENCIPRTYLTEGQLIGCKADGRLTMPFDLAVTPIKTVTECLKTNFENFFSDLEYGTFKDGTCWYQKDGVKFIHDLDCSGDQLDKLKERYLNRIKNFNEAIQSGNYTFFVLHSLMATTSQVNDLYEQLKTIRKEMPFKLLILDFQNNIQENDLDKNILLLSIKHPFSDVDNWWVEEERHSEEGIKFETEVINFIKKEIKQTKGIKLKKYGKRNLTFVQKLFSVYNEEKFNGKFKTINILGLNVKRRIGGIN